MNVGGCIGVYMCVVYYHMNANEFYVAFMETETFRSQRMGKNVVNCGECFKCGSSNPTPPQTIDFNEFLHFLL